MFLICFSAAEQSMNIEFVRVYNWLTPLSIASPFSNSPTQSFHMLNIDKSFWKVSLGPISNFIFDLDLCWLIIELGHRFQSHTMVSFATFYRQLPQYHNRKKEYNKRSFHHMSLRLFIQNWHFYSLLLAIFSHKSKSRIAIVCLNIYPSMTMTSRRPFMQAWDFKFSCGDN